MVSKPFQAKPRMAATIFVACMTLMGSAQAARVVLAQGNLSLERGDKTLPVVAGMQLQEEDVLHTAAGGETLLRFDNGARMLVRADSAVRFTTLRERGPVSKRRKAIRLVQGGLRYITGVGAARHRVAFETDTATIGIRGTDLDIAVSKDAQPDAPTGTYLQVNQGAAVLQALDGTVLDVERGEQAFGGEPDLTPKGEGGVKRPAGRKLQGLAGIFKKSGLDALMK